MINNKFRECTFVLILALAMLNIGCRQTDDNKSTQREPLSPSNPVERSDDNPDERQYWIDLARSNALESDTACRRIVCAMVGDEYLMKGDLEAFYRTYQEFDCADRLEMDLPDIVQRLTLNGHLNQAEMLLDNIDETVLKDRCRSRIARALLKQHRFEEASRFESELEDPTHKSLFQESLAMALADSGKWSEAHAIVKKMSRPAAYSARDWDPMINSLRDHVQQRESTKYAKSPQPKSGGIAQTYRHVANLFGSSYQGNDLDSAATKAPQIADPEDRAVLWRAIAWYRIEKNENELARQALTSCTNAASKIKDPGLKSIQLVLAADAWLEIGDIDSSKSAILQSNAAGENVMPAMQGLNSFITGPVVVGVYVRVGETEFAFKQLCDQKSDVSVGWAAFGGFCADCDQLDFVKKHFLEIPSTKYKAFTAMGVAETLSYREQTE